MKPGYQTTEFWSAIVPIVASLTLKEGANQGTLIICGTCLMGLYILSRTFVKWKGKEGTNNEESK